MNAKKPLSGKKKKKHSNEEMIIEIKELDRKKKEIQPEKARCLEVLEDIR